MLTFNNENIDNKIKNQFVIRIFDMKENKLRTNQLLNDLNADYLVDYSEEKRKDDFRAKNSFIPKFEYTLDSTAKHFIANSSYIKIQYLFK